MADNCCDTVIGGTYSVKIDGETYEGMGDLTISPAAVERSAAATANGRMVVTEKAKLVTAKLNFANICKLDPRKLTKKRCRVDIVFVETSRGKRHMFAGGMITGNPEVNLSTGEWSGFEFSIEENRYITR